MFRTQDSSQYLDHHSHQSHQTPLTPTYTSPRLPPTAPSFNLNKGTGTFKAFFRSPNRVRSGTSLHSAYSASASTHSSNFSSDKHNHPFTAMPSAPLPVVSSHDKTDDEDECPVCLEPLSFSFRLPGEKPHIVPECGHALHEVSFC